MKKITVLIAPLMAISFLASCGGNKPDPTPGTKEYIVTFDSNGGTLIPAQIVKEKEKVNKPTNPIKETDDLIYKFIRWELLDGSEFNFDTKITNDITLKAKWSENGEIKASWEELATTKTETYHVGDYKYVTVNNQPHKVRIIGTKHDNLVDEAGQVTSEKANYTFEFANLISDKNGYSLATLWQDPTEDDFPPANYFESVLRKAIDGESTANLSWYETESSITSTRYTTPVINMLPNDLTSHLKTVEKNVRIYEDVDDQHFNPYNAKLFLLTHDEMDTNSIAGGSEGTTYQFYKNNNSDSARIKHQVKWHDGAASNYTAITDKGIGGQKSYAGFNSNEKEDGGLYWSISPHHRTSSYAQRIEPNGEIEISGYAIYMFALGVAPAFCI